MLPLAAAIATWLQVLGTLIAATAALASWAAVVQARRATEDARQAERDGMLPLLLVSPSVLSGAGFPALGVSVYNAGGGIAQNVAVFLVAENAYGRTVVDFVRPGETITFGSDLDATDHARAIVYTRSADGRQLLWSHENERRELPGTAPAMPSWDDVFDVFYPGEDLGEYRPGRLLRGQ